jgi:hypothetical protein
MAGMGGFNEVAVPAAMAATRVASGAKGLAWLVRAPLAMTIPF